MKKIVSLLFQAVMLFSLQAQKVSNYTYLLDNGINVKMEQCWNHVWVNQSFEALKDASQAPVVLSVRTLGDLTSNSSFKLYSSGKEVNVKGIKPGTYNMKTTFKLSGKPGALSFDLDNIVVKPQTKTTIQLTIYDYQVIIDETPGNQKGLAQFSSGIERFKGNPETNPTCGVPTFYLKGNHNKPVAPNETSDNKSGRIKSGTYDIMITFGAPALVQKVWLENFTMKQDVSYKITINLNAGTVEYSGVNRDVKALYLYPAGMADRQKGAATPDKNYEIIKCEELGITTVCPPGTYDVLLNHNNGARYEWRKNIVVKTGSRTQVK